MDLKSFQNTVGRHTTAVLQKGKEAIGIQPKPDHTAITTAGIGATAAAVAIGSQFVAARKRKMDAKRGIRDKVLEGKSDDVELSNESSDCDILRILDGAKWKWSSDKPADEKAFAVAIWAANQTDASDKKLPIQIQDGDIDLLHSIMDKRKEILGLVTNTLSHEEEALLKNITREYYKHVRGLFKADQKETPTETELFKADQAEKPA